MGRRYSWIRSKGRSLLAAEIGRRAETEIESALKDSGYFDTVIKHAPNSKEDRSGRDFTVSIDGKKKSFGMSTSSRSVLDSKKKHPLVPQIWYAPEMQPWFFVEKVLDLFDEE